MMERDQLDVVLKLRRASLHVEHGELVTARELVGEATDLLDRILGADT